MSDFNLSVNPPALSPDDPLIQHAFRGSSFAVVRLEELNEISNLKADAVACYRPANSQELFAVERIALCQQAIFRGYRLESGLFTVALDHALDATCQTFRPMAADLLGDGDIEITCAQNRNYAAGEGARQMSVESDVWTLLIRYQVNADRQYRRAVEDYERVKRLRPEMPNQPGDPKLQPTPPGLDDSIASFSELGRSYLEPRPPVAPEPPPPSGHAQTPPAPPVAAQLFTKAQPDFTPTAAAQPASLEAWLAAPVAPLALPFSNSEKYFFRGAGVQLASNARKTTHRHSESGRPSGGAAKAPVYHEVSGLSTVTASPRGAGPESRRSGRPSKKRQAVVHLKRDKRRSIQEETTGSPSIKRKETNG
jgi:hypothetical protein